MQNVENLPLTLESFPVIYFLFHSNYFPSLDENFKLKYLKIINILKFPCD